MNKELARALTDMAEIIKDWNSNLIAREEDFIFRLRLINARIALLLPEVEKQSKQLQL